MKSLLRCAVIALLTPFTVLAQGGMRWFPYGPNGGDARAFAQDPSDHNHLYLGTVAGTVYDTHDGGRSWRWLAQPGKRDDLAFDNIVVDPVNPARILAAGWAITHGGGGGLYVSEDQGKTWKSAPMLEGHSIRSMAVAPSNPKVWIVGALDGVYRSRDGGATWALISPEGSTEIHEVESVAIDPKDPNVLYAGTWHLPWKTSDGGANWTNMKEGIIDDSDVFSIIVNPQKPQQIFLSACSGIYRSSDAGEQFTKIQGIPATARRTRVLMQDPGNLATVFAGTTEGLWRTTDNGKTFLRFGDPSWIINDVAIDPTDSNHVLLATDRNGILLSHDGGLTFAPSNRGFASHQIAATAQDRANPGHIWLSVLNDKEAGGVFSTTNGGLTWQQTSNGLNGADIFSLAQSPDGTLFAGGRHGIYSLRDDAWQSTGLTLSADDPMAVKAPTPKRPVRVMKGKSSAKHSSVAAKPATTAHSASVGTGPQHDATAAESSTGVYALITAGDTVFAGTDEGILASGDSGRTWTHIQSTSGKPWHLLAAASPRVLAADQKNLDLSVDHGRTFHAIAAPIGLTYVTGVAIDASGRIWAGGPQGVFYSENDGVAWKSLKGLFVPNVSGLTFDRVNSRVLVTTNEPGTTVFAVHTPDLTVTYNDAGWPLRSVVPVGDHLLGVTPFDGIVLQPRMVVSDTTPFK